MHVLRSGLTVVVRVLVERLASLIPAELAVSDVTAAPPDDVVDGMTEAVTGGGAVPVLPAASEAAAAAAVSSTRSADIITQRLGALSVSATSLQHFQTDQCLHWQVQIRICSDVTLLCLR